MRQFLIILLLISFSSRLAAQKKDTAFKPGFIMHLKLHNGMATNFKSTSLDPYVSGIQLVPQYTLVMGKLRRGIIADAFYTGKKFQAAFGPALSIK